MRTDKVVPIRSAVLAEIWSVEPGPDTTFEDVRRACRALDLVPFVDGFTIGMTLSRFDQTPPTSEEVARALFGVQ